MKAYKCHVTSQQFTMTDREINKTGRKQNCSTFKNVTDFDIGTLTFAVLVNFSGIHLG